MKFKWGKAYQITCGALFINYISAINYLADNPNQKCFVPETIKSEHFKNVLNHLRAYPGSSLNFIESSRLVEEVPVIINEDHNTAWAVKVESGPWELCTYELQSEKEKKKRALAKLTDEEKKILGLINE